MIYQLITQLQSGVPVSQVIAGFVALAIALVLGITVHEFSHALAATWLGDSLPGRQGRLSLSPLAHLDVMGSLMFVVGGFGWGKPVQYNPFALRAGARTGPAIVSAAGPISNVILAILVAIPTRLVGLVLAGSAQSTTGLELLFLILANIVQYNLILSFFNLIPVSPLDGFTILLGLLPPELADQFEQTRQYGIFLLFALVFLGSSIMGIILYQPVSNLTDLLIGM